MRKFIIIVCFFGYCFIAHGQLAEIMSQRITFQKNTVNIGELLNELLHIKKINISYSPDAVNTEDRIVLPSKELMVKEVLFLICNKTGNKLVIKGNLMVLKKDIRHIVIPDPIKTDLKQVSIDSIKVRETIEKPIRSGVKLFLIPFDTLNLRVDQSRLFSKLVLSNNVAKPLPIDSQYPGSDIVRKNVKKDQVYRKNLKFGAGAAVEIAYLNVKSDSLEHITGNPGFGWTVKTDMTYWFARKWFFETGPGFNQTINTFQSKFNSVVYADSLRLDSVSYQSVQLNINRLEVPVLLNYSLIIKRSTLVLGLGGSIQYGLNGKRVTTTNQKSERQTVSWNTSSKPVSLLNNSLYLNRIGYCLLGQIGYQHYNIQIQATAKIGLTPLLKYQSGKLMQFSLTFQYQLFSTH